MDRYVRCCNTCARNKSSSTAPGGLLQPLPIPDEPWDEVSMDFITQLPETRQGHDDILVFVDGLTKMIHFVPTTTDVDAEETTRLFFEHVFCLHGMANCVSLDRDSCFTSRVWIALMEYSGTAIDLSSAFHPQTDGQTERVNRTLEQNVCQGSPLSCDPCDYKCSKHYAHNVLTSLPPWRDDASSEVQDHHYHHHS